MKKLKRVLLGLLIVVVISTLGFFIWANNPAQPSETALNALSTDAQVVIRQEDGFITFVPVQARTSTGFIFYPGGRVDYRAYAPVLRKIAEQGYFVALMEVKFNLAYFDINAGDKVIDLYPQIEHWAVGGHSLGGVAAAEYAGEHPDSIRAIAFWASYPSNDSLKDSNILMMSIYGTNDGLASNEEIEASKALLPAHAQFVPIDGGNHAQFGSYGPQSGDNPATISAEEQWTQIANATVRLLASLVK